MQKKIIALAVAGLVSGAAWAQTNVTVYGRADLGYAYSKSDFRKFQGIENGNGIGGGGSRLGFMGEESLGNGLKAVFKFEWGTNADVGDGPTGARYTYVGLAGGFGNVLFGRNGTAADYYLGATGVMGINGFEPINQFRGKMPLMDGGQRWNNSITYNSPNFSGFDLMAIYSFGENVSRSKVNKDDSNCSNRNASLTNGTTPSNFADNANRKCADSTDGGRLGLGVRYANGPLYLAAAYHVRFDNDSSKADPSVNTRALNAGFGAKGWGLGGSYDFKVVKVYANYFRVKANHGGIANGVDEGVARRDVGSDKQTAWSLGIGVPVSGAGTVVAEYAQYKDYYGGIANARVSDEGDNTYPNYLAGRDAGHKAKGYTIGYKHVMSKRTSLYTYATRINNDRGINAGWDKTGVAGEDQTIFTAGILHTF